MKYEIKINKKKLGLKQNVSGFCAYSIGRVISYLKTINIITNYKLNISKVTYYQTLHEIGYKCRKAASQ